jgi:ribosomal protein L16/L10AE
MRAKITKRAVDAAEMQPATYLVRDSKLKGFVLVVTPGGAKSYAIDYRTGSGRGSPKRRLTTANMVRHLRGAKRGGCLPKLPLAVIRRRPGRKNAMP